jgi:hypothetical protein
MSFVLWMTSKGTIEDIPVEKRRVKDRIVGDKPVNHFFNVENLLNLNSQLV